MTTWIVLRAAGIGAYVVLFASVAFGLVATSGPFGKRFAKASSISIHQYLVHGRSGVARDPHRWAVAGYLAIR